MKTRKKVTILSAFYKPAYRGGGPIRTLEALIGQHSASMEFTVYCSNGDLNTSSALNVPTNSLVPVGEANVYYANWKSALGRILLYWKSMRHPAEFLYINSFFSLWFSIIPTILYRAKLSRASSIVLAPRGELGAGALALKVNKKAAFIKLAKILRLHSGVIWHASSHQEESEIRSHFPGAKIVIREDEVNLPNEPMPPIESIQPRILRLIYVGRIARKKGVHTLLEALSGVDDNIRVDVIGDFESEHYKRELMNLARELPNNVQLDFKGPIDHALIRDQFSRYDLFVFPTTHENFGHTIAESISASCPVMISNASPLTQVIQRGAGVIVKDVDAQSWAREIHNYALLSDAERYHRRVEAGRIYQSWRSEKSDLSVFELAILRGYTS